MIRTLEFASVLLLCVALLALLPLAAAKGYEYYRRFRRQQDYEDSVIDRMTNPEKYDKR